MPKPNLSSRPDSYALSLIAAVAAGLTVGLITAHSQASDGEVMLLTYLRLVLVSVCSYVAVQFLMIRRERSQPLRFSKWIVAAVLGSTINFLIVHLPSDLTYIWNFRNSSVIGYASGALKGEIVRLVITVITDSLLALLAMALIRYTYYALVGKAQRASS